MKHYFFWGHERGMKITITVLGSIRRKTIALATLLGLWAIGIMKAMRAYDSQQV
jgi:hypothetical protein